MKRHSLKKLVGLNVRQLREKQGLKQDEMSALAGISKTAMSLIESGSVWPQFGTLRAIAGVLKVSVESLFNLNEMLPPSAEEALQIVADKMGYDVIIRRRKHVRS